MSAPEPLNTEVRSPDGVSEATETQNLAITQSRVSNEKITDTQSDLQTLKKQSQPVSRSTDFETLYNYFYGLDVSPSTDRIGNAITRNTPVTDTNEVVSFPLTASVSHTFSNSPVPAHIQPLQISIADDCINYELDESGTLCPALDSSVHVQRATSLASALKVKLTGEIMHSSSVRPIQTPQLIAYLYGVLLAVKDRINIHRNQPTNLWRSLCAAGRAAQAKPFFDEIPNNKFRPGALVAPPLPEAGFGPFPAEGLNQNSKLDFKAKAYVFYKQRTYNPDDMNRAFWFIWAIYNRMPNDFQNSYPLNITFCTSELPVQSPMPTADGISAEQCDKALLLLDKIVLEFFNNDRKLAYYYVFKGSQFVMRPCSCYQEGGLIRKASRNVALRAFTGIYYLAGFAEQYANMISCASHPGIIGALFQYVDTMVLQAVFSLSGPKLVRFAAPPEYQGRHACPFSFVADENYWGIAPGSNAEPVGMYYTEIIQRKTEHNLFTETFMDIYGSTASVICANIETSLFTSGTEVINQRMQNDFARDTPKPGTLRHQHAIINRFHEPEYAYRLGILADGIIPLSGSFEVDILKEAERLITGEDIRNLPGLRCLCSRGLDAILGLRPIQQKRKKMCYFRTLDGNFHEVTIRSETRDLQVWRDHGYLARPYACHIVDSDGIEFYDKSNGLYKGRVNVLISGFAIPGRAYQGPSLAGSNRGRPDLSDVPATGSLSNLISLSKASRLPYRKRQNGVRVSDYTVARELACAFRNSRLTRQMDHVTDIAYLNFLRWVLLPYNGQTVRPHPTEWGQTPYPEHVNLKFLSKEMELELFPLKKAPQADLKVNCYARNILASTELTDDLLKRCLPVGLNNDSVCGIVIVLELLLIAGVPSKLLPVIGQAIANKDPFIKELSDFNKMIGATSSRIANILTECNTLIGRGVKSSDPSADLYHRVAPEGNRHEAKISRHILIEAINKIYKNEMTDMPPPGDFMLHLITSPLWCKAGSHHHPHFAKYGSRLEFVMDVPADKIAAEPPAVYITQAEKLEHGKTRYIYNCDTIAYLFFDYILHYVECVWSNESVLLNPAAMSVERFSVLDYPEYCMIDYTDFNSQHSLESQKLVFECLRPYLPSEMHPILDWCITSMDHMEINGQHWLSTLPSGHRATTFINSVLNKAYLIPYIGDTVSFHCGDDVLLCGEYDYQTLIDTLPYELNKSKQSFGPNAEFLRLHRRGGDVIGYPSRAVSSLVSGNWLSKTSWEWQPSLISVTNQCNVIISRSQLNIRFIPAMQQELRNRYADKMSEPFDVSSDYYVMPGCPCYSDAATTIVPNVPKLEHSDVPFSQAQKLFDTMRDSCPEFTTVNDIIDKVRARRSSSAASNITYNVGSPVAPQVCVVVNPNHYQFLLRKRYYPREHIAPPGFDASNDSKLVFTTYDLAPSIAMKSCAVLAPAKIICGHGLRSG
uniref:RNA-directed RNA polymerase n=1 Tax=Trichomonas vaginalis virus 3 TaxID=170965 RepID=F5B2V6_9VIRU|nr:RNA-dependent RNA polymerase [Trichomonas vaginalis virus 3]